MISLNPLILEQSAVFQGLDGLKRAKPTPVASSDTQTSIPLWKHKIFHLREHHSSLCEQIFINPALQALDKGKTPSHLLHGITQQWPRKSTPSQALQRIINELYRATLPNRTAPLVSFEAIDTDALYFSKGDMQKEIRWCQARCLVISKCFEERGALAWSAFAGTSLGADYSQAHPKLKATAQDLSDVLSVLYFGPTAAFAIAYFHGDERGALAAATLQEESYQDVWPQAHSWGERVLETLPGHSLEGVQEKAQTIVQHILEQETLPVWKGSDMKKAQGITKEGIEAHHLLAQAALALLNEEEEPSTVSKICTLHHQDSSWFYTPPPKVEKTTCVIQ